MQTRAAAFSRGHSRPTLGPYCLPGQRDTERAYKLNSALKLVLVRAHASENVPLKRLRAICMSSSWLNAGPIAQDSGTTGPVSWLLFRLLQAGVTCVQRVSCSSSSGGFRRRRRWRQQHQHQQQVQRVRTASAAEQAASQLGQSGEAAGLSPSHWQRAAELIPRQVQHLQLRKQVQAPAQLSTQRHRAGARAGKVPGAREQDMMLMRSKVSWAACMGRPRLNAAVLGRQQAWYSAQHSQEAHCTCRQAQCTSSQLRHLTASIQVALHAAPAAHRYAGSAIFAPASQSPCRSGLLPIRDLRLEAQQ